MATREVLVYVCDLCSEEGEVQPHEITVDGRTTELESCALCWSEPVAILDKLASAGRTSGRRKRLPTLS